MTSYLYVLSIGPVQDFIAAARRTRDLWMGSHLLSEISKAAAKKIADMDGILIFPGLDKNNQRLIASDERLIASDERMNDSEDEFNVANVILAQLPEGIKSTPEMINESAQEAANGRWKKIAKEARSNAKGVVRYEEEDLIGQKIWDDQVADAIEFYAAWVPETSNYSQDRMKVMRLLAGRKSIRNFKIVCPSMPEMARFGIPKSSLDGARESVLQKNKQLSKKMRIWLRLSEGEQLCAIGLTKRLGTNPDKKVAAFPSVVRVAADPWIRGIKSSPSVRANELLGQIKKCCEGENSFSSGCGKRLYKDFPFDAHILYPNRLLSSREELKKILKKDTSFKDDSDNLDKIEKAINELQKRKDGGLGLGEPIQYLAVLRADGDRMGVVLSKIESKEDHRSLSMQLAEFASDARGIVEGEQCRGSLVYSGGDDVLAFLPLDTCLDAARALHDRFGKIQPEGGNPLTLSVGIAIGHYLEPLENLLGFAKDAERAAKRGRPAKTGSEDEAIADVAAVDDERDGLAVQIYPRSGSPIKIREKWRPEGKNGLDERLLKWAEMHCKDEIPDSAAYEMHQLSEDYSKWWIPDKDPKIKREKLDELRELIISDALRLLKRKSGDEKAGKILKEDLESMLKGPDPREAISMMALELILSRRISEAMRQAKGKRSGKDAEPEKEVA